MIWTKYFRVANGRNSLQWGFPLFLVSFFCLVMLGFFRYYLYPDIIANCYRKINNYVPKLCELGLVRC